MKKYSIITVILVFMAFVFALPACADETKDKQKPDAEYTVYFESDGEIVLETRKKNGESIERPKTPTKTITNWTAGIAARENGISIRIKCFRK